MTMTLKQKILQLPVDMEPSKAAAKVKCTPAYVFQVRRAAKEAKGKKPRAGAPKKRTAQPGTTGNGALSFEHLGEEVTAIQQVGVKKARAICDFLDSLSTLG